MSAARRGKGVQREEAARGGRGVQLRLLLFASPFLWCLLLFRSAGAVGEVAAGAGAAGPWEACDHLDPSAGFGSATGWRCELEALTREAVEGEWETALRLGRETAGGLGFAGSWRRAWNGEAGAMDEAQGWIVRRGAGHRLAAGVGGLSFAGQRQGRIQIDLRLQPCAPLLAGLRGAVYPADGAAASAIVASLHAGLGPWWGGLEAGPQPGGLRVALGLRAAPGLSWTVAYAGAAPTLGIALRRPAFELRAEDTAHPLLGRVSRVRLVLGGGGR